jgi:SAM-dependent methyltransferase
MNESERIKAVYTERKKSGKDSIYTFLRPSELFIFQQREREILKSLAEVNIDSENIKNKNILDVGCGYGTLLRDFIKYGANPENLHGIDLLPEHVEGAKKLAPNIFFSRGNAETLPYKNDFFDILLCFTVFSSILETKMALNIAQEILRILKKGGLLIWYDFFISHPLNPDTRGIGKKEIIRLFPDCNVTLHKITLAPPLTRKLIPHFWGLGYFLESLKILNTHYLGIITKL